MKSGFARSASRSWLGILSIAAVAVSLVVIPGCGAKRSTPEKAAEAYLKAMKKSDMDAMLDCCAPDLRRIMEEAIKEGGKDKAAKQMTGAGKVESYKVLKADVKGDWADVEYSLTVDGKKHTDKLTLHKIKGEWLADLPKELELSPELMKVGEELKKLKEQPAPKEQ